MLADSTDIMAEETEALVVPCVLLSRPSEDEGNVDRHQS